METLARYELKYGIRPDLMDSIRAFIRPYCAADPHAGSTPDGFYTIDSLYFDSDDYRCYWDTRNRAPLRAKVRVRSYPASPGGIVKFEVKNRIHDLIIKSSAVLPVQDWTKWLHCRRECPDAHTGAALDSFLTMSQAYRARPKMLVRYRRLAFVGTVDDYARVTFDRQMVCQPMTHCSLEGWPQAWKPIDDPGAMGSSSCLVMELKFRNRAPLWMSELVRRFGLTRQGYSKYACAVARHVLDTPRYWDMIPHHSGGEAQWIS